MHISMPINEVNVTRSCKECNTEIETISVKKDNMRLITEDLTWCPTCNKDTNEVRDIAGRTDSIKIEQDSYPPVRAVE